jgi:AcrR family transcriptional regulator
MYIGLWLSHDMSPRPYQSPRRSAGATKTRERLVKAAAAILGSADGIGVFSLEAVARKAGVTRLTVYNHFGSRRALLEAVFDDRAMRGGLHRLKDVMADSDPQAGLLRVIEIFCEFWSFDAATLGLLHAAGASDPEFAASVHERNERRRHIMSVLIRRMTAGRRTKPREIDDLVDVLFALTSFHFFSQLTTGERTSEATCKLIQGLALDAVERAFL